MIEKCAARSLPGFDGPQVLLCPARQPGEGGPDRRAVLGEFVAHADRPVVDHRAGGEAEVDQFDEALVEDAVVDARDAPPEVAEIDRSLHEVLHTTPVQRFPSRVMTRDSGSLKVSHASPLPEPANGSRIATWIEGNPNAVGEPAPALGDAG